MERAVWACRQPIDANHCAAHHLEKTRREYGCTAQYRAYLLRGERDGLRENHPLDALSARRRRQRAIVCEVLVPLNCARTQSHSTGERGETWAAGRSARRPHGEKRRDGRRGSRCGTVRCDAKRRGTERSRAEETTVSPPAVRKLRSNGFSFSGAAQNSARESSWSDILICIQLCGAIRTYCAVQQRTAEYNVERES